MSTKKPKVYSNRRQSNNRTFKNPTRHSRQNMYKRSDWVQYRRRFLYHNPNCYACGGKASVVDHIVPHKGDIALFEATSNHLPMCTTCHNTVTSLFDRNYKIGENVEPKGEWLERQRKKAGNTSKVNILPSYK